MRKKETITEGLDWNVMIGLATRLRQDGLIKDYLLITTGSYFGLRISDLLSLRYTDVLYKDEIILTEQKTRKQRRITIHPKVKEALEYVMNQLRQQEKFRDNSYLFETKYGSTPTISYINKRLKLIFNRYNVNVRKASSHTLRKTFGKALWERDGRSERSLIYLSELFGHSSTAITRRYIGLQSEMFSDMYLSL